MAEEKDQLQPGYLRTRGLYWRSVGEMALFLALCWAGAAALAYLILSPDLAKDYFSAHRTVKATWVLVVPALAVSAGVGFLAAGVGVALGLRRHSRLILEPLRRIDGLLRAMAGGRLPRPDPAAGARGAEAEVAEALEPLRARVDDLQRIARELQKVSLEFNYRSAGTEGVTLKDFRGLADRLDALSKDLARVSGWFEG